MADDILENSTNVDRYWRNLDIVEYNGNNAFYVHKDLDSSFYDWRNGVILSDNKLEDMLLI